MGKIVLALIINSETIAKKNNNIFLGTDKTTCIAAYIDFETVSNHR